MAIQKIKEDNSFNIYHQHFLIDSSDDLASLEANYNCQMGDIAETVDGTKYTRHSAGYSGELWEEIHSSSSGGTSTDNGTIVIDLEELTPLEVDGINTVYVSDPGSGSWFPMDNCYIYEKTAILTSTPIFLKQSQDIEQGEVLGKVIGYQPLVTYMMTFPGTAEDPNAGDAEGLYLTSSSVVYNLTDENNFSIFIFPSDANFAIGHFTPLV